MSLRFTITFVLSIICLTVPAWEDFQAGMDANSWRLPTALREWRPLAEQGDALAQYNLGVLYRKGRGVPQDNVQARQWYAKAAAQGQAKAQFNLGTLYFNGEESRKTIRRPCDGSVWPQTKERLSLKRKLPSCTMKARVVAGSCPGL
jgi:TPR repeat protein